MTKRTGNVEATQAGNGTGGALAEALRPLIAGMTATVGDHQKARKSG
jgi:hypothetical protein